MASVWFGNRIFDGVLFPVLALAFAYAARVALAATIKPAVFKVAIPILISLVVIRLSVRVLTPHVPGRALGAHRRAQHLVAGLDRRRPLDHRRLADGARRDGRRALEGRQPQMTLRNVVEGGITAGIVLVLSLWVSAAIERKLLSSGSGHDLSLRKIAANVVRALLLFFGLLIALSAVGIDLTALSVLGGAIGVGLGFGLQKIAANYISGFVILAERSLRIGDMVKVDTFEGRITDIRTRYTVIRSLGGREAIVPNETLITTRVENASLADPRVLVTTAVQVAYGTDVRALQPQARGGDRRRGARHRRPGAVGAARRVLGRRHGPDDQLLDPRSGERPGQRQVGRQPRRARRARSRRHRDPVPAARRPRRRLAGGRRGARRPGRLGAAPRARADRGCVAGRLRCRRAASAGAGRARARRPRSSPSARRTA